MSSEPDLSASGQPFLFSASNYTLEQVTDAAERYSAEISRLGIGLHIEMPWDLRLAPRTVALINETSSAFDGLYRIEEIERHFSSMSGSTQIVRAVMI